MPTPPSPGRTSPILVLGLAIAIGGAAARAQTPPPASLPNPRLNWVAPAGGKRGTTFEVAVDGFDLDGPSALQFDDPGITAVPKIGEPGLGQTGPQVVPNTFNVTIQPGVRPGIYEARVAGKYGVSSPRAFVVGARPELKEVEPNNAFDKAMAVPLGVTINGNTKETATDYYRFSARRGQRIIIDCWAFRIDSNVDATLVLYDSEGKELGRDRNTNRRDPLIDFTAPRDGDYVIGLYDYLYGYNTWPGECFYRLTISTGPYLDFVFPPAGLPGSQGQYTVYGRNLPGGQPVPGLTVGGKALERLTVGIALPADKADRLEGDLLVDPSEAFVDGVEYRLDSPEGPSNPLRVSMAGAPVVIEAEPNDDASRALAVRPPCEVAGQFYPRDDRDWVTFEAKKGEVYWIEVFSQRLGLPTDPFLLVQQVKKDAKGVEQATDVQGVDDLEETSSMVHWSFLSGLLFNTATHDPAYRLTVPEDGTYRVMVRDQARGPQGDPRSVYRLVIRPPQPDFRLVAVPRAPAGLLPEQGLLMITQTTTWSALLRRGGAELIEVFAIRRDGFEGEIRVSAENLPAGVTAAPVVLSPILRTMAEPVKRTATLVLRAADDAPSATASIAITGKAKIGQADVVHRARTGTMVWPTLPIGLTYPRSRLAHRLALTVLDSDPVPFRLDVAPDLVLETSRFGTVKFPVNVARRGGFAGKVALSVYGLPPIPYNVMHAQPLFTTPREIKANENATEYALTMPAGTPTGTYSLFLNGVGTISYARNPEALKAAQDRKAAVEKLVAETSARAKAAVEAQAAAEKARLAATPDKLKAATEAKLATDKAVAETDAKAKEAAAFLQTFTQDVTKLQEKSKPADLAIGAASATITLKITPAPITLELAPTPLKLKPGAKLDLPVPIKRLYGYADPVQLTVTLPPGVAGIGAPVATIPAGQNQAPLAIEASPGATAGTYAVTVQALARLNGQALVVSQEIPLTIEPAKP